jgi:hypothetical protein
LIQPLLFLKIRLHQKPIPLREKHAQCVKKSGFFIRFFSARNGRILFFEGIFAIPALSGKGRDGFLSVARIWL